MNEYAAGLKHGFMSITPFAKDGSVQATGKNTTRNCRQVVETLVEQPCPANTHKRHYFEY
ncbi:MAG: hypothetical protein V4724_18780 [Pseudomonadota bacterium]